MRPWAAGVAAAILAAGMGPSGGGAQAAVGPGGLQAQAAVLYDPQTGQVLYALHPQERLFPASTTKLLTALLVVTHGPPLATKVTVTPADIAVGGSSAPLVPGERISVKNLLYGLLLVSGNDAAMALAQATSGSVARFVALMNLTARQLGAGRCHFENPDGLPNPRHWVTALGLARIAAAAMRQPLIRKILETQVYPFPSPSGHGTVPMVNQDQLLWTYSGIVGGKIGYTTQAGETMAAEARRRGLTLVAVVLHDTYSHLFQDPAALLTYGFRHYRRVRLVAPGQVVARLPVTGFRHRMVPAVAVRGFSWDVPVGGVDPRLNLHLPRRLAQGLRAGRRLGSATVEWAGRPVGTLPLVLATATPRAPRRPPSRTEELAAVLAALALALAWIRARRGRRRRRVRYRLRWVRQGQRAAGGSS